LILNKVPTLIRKECGYNDVRLLNEQYVVKPAGCENATFFWHRDADTLLERITSPDPTYHAFQRERLAREAKRKKLAPPPPPQPSPTASKHTLPPTTNFTFTNAWIPLDPVGSDNGTLVLLPANAEGDHVITGLSTTSGPTAYPCTECREETGDAAVFATHTVHVNAQPGDVILFSSAIFHRSGQNRGKEDRSVFYVQYSEGPLLREIESPLWLAVPCTALDEGVDAEDTEKDHTNRKKRKTCIRVGY
jgi:hypothetical protein